MRPPAPSRPVAPAASRQFWESSSARLAARINLAVWLEHFGPWAFGVCSAAAVAVYALRRQAGPEHWAWVALVLAAAGAAGLAWRRGRARRYAAADARVLLESVLRLDTRLSAAHDGVAPWPAPHRELPPVVRWRSLAAPGWMLGGLALLALGAWAPLAGSRPDERPPVEKPPALAQTEAMLQELSRLEVADPASLEQLEAQTRELAARPTEEQYTHSALEAADTLRDQAMAAIQTLARGYDGAAAALGAREEAAAGTGPEGSAGGGRLAAALDGLRSGRLAGHPELLKSLAAAQTGRSGMSREQLQQLQSRLNQAGAQARGVAGAAGAGARMAQPGEGTGEGEGGADKEGKGPGRGGVNRGRGDAPLTMTLDPSARQEGRIEGVAGDDFSRASLGDLTGTERGGAHEVDPNRAHGSGAAGTVAGPARGGDAVWVDRLSPGDRAVLREFFK